MAEPGVRDAARGPMAPARLRRRRSDRFDLPRGDRYRFRGVTRLGRLFSYDTRSYLGVRRALRVCRRWVSRA